MEGSSGWELGKDQLWSFAFGASSERRESFSQQKSPHFPYLGNRILLLIIWFWVIKNVGTAILPESLTVTVSLGRASSPGHFTLKHSRPSTTYIHPGLERS